MQSDTALDILDSLKGCLGDIGVEPDDEGDVFWSASTLLNDQKARDGFVAAVDLFWPEVVDWIEAFHREQILAAQVLTVHMVAAGMNIDRPMIGTNRPITLRDSVVQTADYMANVFEEEGCIEAFEANDSFRKAIAAYDGTPVLLGGEGLFSAMAKRMSENSP